MPPIPILRTKEYLHLEQHPERYPKRGKIDPYI
jgi:hypothetical protein